MARTNTIIGERHERKPAIRPCHQAESERAEAKKGADHAKVCKDWEDKDPAGAPLDIVEDTSGASGAKLGDLTVAHRSNATGRWKQAIKLLSTQATPDSRRG
jgi:hypothetical protein